MAKSNGQFKVQAFLSALTILIGLLLMVVKIVADSEPGAIPLLLVVLGVGWFSVTKVRMRTDRNQPQ
jgi:hypothetical protein